MTNKNNNYDNRVGSPAGEYCKCCEDAQKRIRNKKKIMHAGTINVISFCPVCDKIDAMRSG